MSQPRIKTTALPSYASLRKLLRRCFILSLELIGRNMSWFMMTTYVTTPFNALLTHGRGTERAVAWDSICQILFGW